MNKELIKNALQSAIDLLESDLTLEDDGMTCLCCGLDLSSEESGGCEVENTVHQLQAALESLREES